MQLLDWLSATWYNCIYLTLIAGLIVSGIGRWLAIQLLSSESLSAIFAVKQSAGGNASENSALLPRWNNSTIAQVFVSRYR